MFQPEQRKEPLQAGCRRFCEVWFGLASWLFLALEIVPLLAPGGNSDDGTSPAEFFQEPVLENLGGNFGDVIHARR